MLDDIKKEVFEANIALKKNNLVILTWGNVSAIDRGHSLIVIKPSGVSYENMKYTDMVVLDLDGKVVEGSLRPSSDTMTHIALYREFADIVSVIHTHSTYATIFAQAKKDIEVFGTTHADYFYGAIPCTRELSSKEIYENYEYNTGLVIIETFKSRNILPSQVPAVVVASHGPFVFGSDVGHALENAIVLEEVSKMAMDTKMLSSDIKHIDKFLLDKHYLRKHGKGAYYGQKQVLFF